jgi:cobalt-zinc-cadmium efflux system outer membrane protein
MSVRTIRTACAALAIAHSAAAGQLVSPSTVAATVNQYYDSQRGISLDEAIDMAIAQEPALRAARADIDVAKGTRTQAGLWPNPSVSFEWRDEPSGTDNQAMIAVQWPLELFRRAGRTNVADREIAIAELSVMGRERTIRADVRARFGDVLGGIRRLTLLDELTAAVRRQRDLLRARVEQGASPPLERDLVEVELQRLEPARLLQVGRIESALFALKRSVGLEATAPLLVRDSLEEIVQREARSLPAVADPAAQMNERADVREAAARIATAKAKVDRAEREGRIDVSLFGSYQRMDAGFPQLGIGSTGSLERVRSVFHYVAGGAMVTIPLSNHNQGEVAAARAEHARAVANHEAARLSAESELAAARVMDQRTHEAAQAYSAEARALARRNLETVGQSYALGRMTVFDVLAEQRRFLEVELAYSDALDAAFVARTLLLQAHGGGQ